MVPITRATLNLTRRCNLSCSYCFNYGKGTGDMSWEIAKKSVDFLISNAINTPEKLIDVSFWGGEPLLMWDLLQEITLYAEKRAKEAGVRVQFGGTTNGTLLTPDKFDFLDEHKIFFLVSFDGTEKTHNMFRAGYRLTRENLIHALKRWPFYRVRISLIPEAVDRFFYDVSEIVNLGCNYIIFSPVYEHDWTDEKWNIFLEQGKKVVDEILRNRNVIIEHFRSYTGRDRSRYPCGAGGSYVGVDYDGAIYPCHRFIKFNDPKPWYEKEVCIGHVEYGITNPEFRNQFLNFSPEKCKSCEFYYSTNCKGGCYAVNFDFNKKIDIPYDGLCKYVKVQKEISNYYAIVTHPMRSCVCNNMCYLEGTESEISVFDPDSEISCVCYNTNYSGPLDPQARPLPMRMIFMDLYRKIKELEAKVERITS